MASLTAAEVVTHTRELLQLLGDAETYRDGWAADAITDVTPIRESLNDFLALLQPTGIRTGDVTFNTVGGTGSYAVDLTLGEIYTVDYAGTMLLPTTRVAELERGTLLSATGLPARYIREGANIRLVPTPSAVATVTMHGTLPLQVFANNQSGTALLYIPEHLQRFVSHGVAAYMTTVDAENQAHAQRYAQYTRNAMFLVTELIRISRPTDFAGRVSADAFIPVPDTKMQGQSGLVENFNQIYAAMGIRANDGTS